MHISAIPGLSFFKAENYEFTNQNICDFSNIPRPHSCMGLILKGEAVFCVENEEIEVKPGDIIFVPITSTYVSKWKGNPDINYISMHFVFDSPSGLFTEKVPLLQKINLTDFESLKSDYEYILNNYNTDNFEKCAQALSKFYSIIAKVSQNLKYIYTNDIDSRLIEAKKFITLNYNKNLSVDDIAQTANMSVSNFYASFKKAFGVSPITYKNKICINHAARMLTCDKHKSIEDISEALGFSSSIYFRRVFKAETGKTPREYRTSEITSL